MRSNFFQFFYANRPFLTGFKQAVKYLLAAESFPAAVFFYHHQRSFFHIFISSKAAAAIRAFAAAPDSRAFGSFPGISNFIFVVDAIRAFHKSFTFLKSILASFKNSRAI